VRAQRTREGDRPPERTRTATPPAQVGNPGGDTATAAGAPPAAKPGGDRVREERPARERLRERRIERRLRERTVRRERER
jgi:hypothetical protein